MSATNEKGFLVASPLVMAWASPRRLTSSAVTGTARPSSLTSGCSITARTQRPYSSISMVGTLTSPEQGSLNAHVPSSCFLINC